MMKFLLFAFAIVAASTIAAGAVEDKSETLVVQTKYGPIKGYKNQAGGYSFLGVPFAEPPVGKNTFTPPAPKKAWTDVLDATEFKSGCIAKCRGKFSSLMCPANTSRDCLFVNIFVGRDVVSSTNPDKMPVWFFTHGGMYLWGSGSIPLYKGDYWAKQNNMIIVTVNYRLNVFGGLVTKAIKGNNQVRDVVEAIKFTHSIIPAFGGDPEKITISGQSAGASTTVALYTVVPSAWPYFRAAMPISSPSGFRFNSLKMAQELGDLVLLKLGCEATGDQREIDCVSAKSDEEILKVESSTFLPVPDMVLNAIMPWMPTVDGEFVVDDPMAAMTRGSFSRKPIYSSDTHSEAIIFADTIYGFSLNNLFLPLALDYIYGWKGGATVEKTYGPIPPNFHNDSKKEQGYMFAAEVLTDYLFVCANEYILSQAHKFGVTAYNLNFQHVGSWAPWYMGPPRKDFGCNIQDGKAENCCAQVGTNRVCHAFDLVTIFNAAWAVPKSMHFPKPTPEENQLGNFMQQKIFANFVHNMTLDYPQFNNETRTTWIADVGANNHVTTSYRAKFCKMFDAVDGPIPYNRH